MAHLEDRTNEAQILAIAERYQNGESAPELARAFNMTADAIYRRLRAVGVTIRSREECARLMWSTGKRSHDRALTNDEIQHALLRYKAGQTAGEIGKQLGVSHTTILDCLRDLTEIRDKAEATLLRSRWKVVMRDGEELRICIRCKQAKPLSSFYKSKNNGRRFDRCIVCIGVSRGKPIGSTERRGTPKALRSATLADIAWAAGFLEGEAHFAFKKGQTQIVVHQVDREPLEHLQEVFGGTIREGSKRYQNNPNWHMQWVWVCSGVRARGISLTVYAFLSERRRSVIRSGMAAWTPRGRYRCD